MVLHSLETELVVQRDITCTFSTGPRKTWKNPVAPEAREP
jgi:hypothetical protein